MLDTHMWVWWVLGSPRLTAAWKSVIEQHEQDGLGVSAISCWEVAKLAETGRLQLPLPVLEWLDVALTYPGVRLLDLSRAIAAESTQLPQPFHRDPADQIITATARVHKTGLLTADHKLREYPHVRTL